MKKLYFAFLIVSLFTFKSAQAQGCVTCALAEIIGQDFVDPSGGRGVYVTTGWTYNVRNIIGRKITDTELENMVKSGELSKKNVSRVRSMGIIYENYGGLRWKVVKHKVSLKSGTAYFVYAGRMIDGFSF